MSTIREGARPCGTRFPAAFRHTGIRFSVTLSRQRGSAPLTIGLPPCLRIPAPARRTLARFTRSARMRPDRIGRLLCPGDSGAHRPSAHPRPSLAASQRTGPCHPSDAIQPGMLVSRGICKGFLIVALSVFPAPVTAMAGAAALGLFRELRTRPVRNRPRTSRRGQVEHNL
jgi:hypothetical protein